MLTLQQVVRRLKDMNISAVAKNTGVHVNTLGPIASGKNTNPSYETMEKISQYFEEREKAEA